MIHKIKDLLNQPVPGEHVSIFGTLFCWQPSLAFYQAPWSSQFSNFSLPFSFSSLPLSSLPSISNNQSLIPTDRPTWWSQIAFSPEHTMVVLPSLVMAFYPSRRFILTFPIHPGLTITGGPQIHSSTIFFILHPSSRSSFAFNLTSMTILSFCLRH